MFLNLESRVSLYCLPLLRNTMEANPGASNSYHPYDLSLQVKSLCLTAAIVF